MLENQHDYRKLLSRLYYSPLAVLTSKNPLAFRQIRKEGENQIWKHQINRKQ